MREGYAIAEAPNSPLDTIQNNTEVILNRLQGLNSALRDFEGRLCGGEPGKNALSGSPAAAPSGLLAQITNIQGFTFDALNEMEGRLVRLTNL